MEDKKYDRAFCIQRLGLELFYKTSATNTFDHKLLLTDDEEDKERYQLLEKTTNKKSIFMMPTTYEILAERGDTSDLRGLMNFTFITLNDMERDNFIRRYV